MTGESVCDSARAPVRRKSVCYCVPVRAAAVELTRARYRQFGFIPKCSAPRVGTPDEWLMVIENPLASLSKRYFIAVFNGETELYRLPFESDQAARKEFERRCSE